MKKYALTAVIWLIAIQFIVFGANKFLLFFIAPPPIDASAQAFMNGMFSSYLGKLVGLTEIIGGLLLLVSTTRFMGLLFLLPVMINIIAYHLAHDMPGNMIWIVVGLLFAWICYEQAPNFKKLIVNVKPA
jgi:putative oxidoreductase